MRVLALFYLVLFSSSLSANTLVLPESSRGELRQSITSSWQLCGESLWCEDELKYYRDSFIAQASLVEGVLRVELINEYSAERLGQIQLYLRQDRFVLTRAEIEGQVFDVDKAIEQTSIEQADRALILFLNQFPQDTNRTLHWQAKDWHAELVSDGELITLMLYQYY